MKFSLMEYVIFINTKLDTIPGEQFVYRIGVPVKIHFLHNSPPPL